MIAFDLIFEYRRGVIQHYFVIVDDSSQCLFLAGNIY